MDNQSVYINKTLSMTMFLSIFPTSLSKNQVTKITFHVNYIHVETH